MKCKILIPNILTLSRIGATIILAWAMILDSNHTSMLWLAILLSGFIYLTDVLDGKLARQFQCCSAFGAKLDISADLLYIMSMDLILIVHKQMSGWIFGLVLGEFFVFAVSSVCYTKSSEIKESCFDSIGRITAGYYYIMPLLYFILSGVQQSSMQKLFITLADLVCVILTLAAIISRVRMCLYQRNHVRSYE